MRLRLILLATLTILTASSVFAAPHRGEKSVGLRGGYNTRNESAAAGIYFQYTFSRHFRLAPNADYIFRHNGTDAFSFNVNTHFPIAFGSAGRFTLYPLAGVNFISWNHKTDNDASQRVMRPGLNFGCGAEYYCTPTLKISLEGKYNLVKAYSSGVFNIGIGYVF